MVDNGDVDGECLAVWLVTSRHGFLLAAIPVGQRCYRRCWMESRSTSVEKDTHFCTRRIIVLYLFDLAVCGRPFPKVFLWP